jgi:hypothetical protein
MVDGSPGEAKEDQYLGKVPDKESFLACRMALTSQSGASYLTLALSVGNLDGILGLVGLIYALNTPFSSRNRSRMALLQPKSIQMPILPLSTGSLEPQNSQVLRMHC